MSTSVLAERLSDPQTLPPVFAEAGHRQETLDGYAAAVERVVRAMRAAPQAEMSLDEMAALAAMSPCHFNRVFRQLTGIPPAQFLSLLRLERAKLLLLTTEASVTEICFEVGYSSLGSFTNRFTQLVGLSPTRLRFLGQHFLLPDLSALCTPTPVQDGPEAASRPPVSGVVEAAEDFRGLICLGLFDSPIPQSRPQACALLSGSGAYRLPVERDGEYFLLAASFREPPRTDAPELLEDLLCQGLVQAVAGAGPISVREGQPPRPTSLRLRPPGLLDPPLLIALPLLLSERLQRRRGRQQRRGVA